MSLADRDSKIILLTKEKKNRQNLLRANYSELVSGLSDNPFLGLVVGNYEKYQDTIVLEKQQQLDVLNKLYDYLLEAPFSVCKKDLALIRSEINKITRYLNDF